MKIFGRIIFGILVSGGLLFLLLNYVSVDDIWNTLKKLSFEVAIYALLIYIFIFILRTLIFKTLIGKQIKFGKLFSIVSMHNFINLFLPLKAGELSFPILIK